MSFTKDLLEEVYLNGSVTCTGSVKITAKGTPNKILLGWDYVEEEEEEDKDDKKVDPVVPDNNESDSAIKGVAFSAAVGITALNYLI